LKLDILVLAAHPDDAELGCGGTIASHVAMGQKVGIIDLTRGELGTRGSAEIRDNEAADAAKILGLTVRENLQFKDGFFKNDEEHQLEVIKMIRKYQPYIVITNAPDDRHTDHGRAAELCYTASFLAGLSKIETVSDGENQTAWRPSQVYHFIQSRLIIPDIIVDVSDHWETKMAAIYAYKSQFHNPESLEPATFISSPSFIKMVEGRGNEFGYSIGVKYGEGFIVKRIPGIKNLKTLL
jgi:N-acetylglucosamine malate deacetylase 1